MKKYLLTLLLFLVMPAGAVAQSVVYPDNSTSPTAVRPVNALWTFKIPSLTANSVICTDGNKSLTTTGCPSSGGSSDARDLTNFGVPFFQFFSATTTTALAEGNNLYWTNIRFDNRLSATTSLPNITTLGGLSLPSSQVTGLPSIIATSTNPMLATYFNATSTTATSTFPKILSSFFQLGTDTINDLTGSGINVAGGALVLDRTGDWTGTLDSIEGASFLRSDASDNFTSGVLSFDSGTTVRFNNTATTSFSGGLLSSTGFSGTYLDVGTIHATSTATSTFVGQIMANRGTLGSVAVTNLASCDTIDTDASGNFLCGTDNTAAGAASTTLLTDNNTFAGLTKFTNSGTTTFAGGIDFTRFNLSATSTGSAGINLTGGCFAINGTCVSGAGSSHDAVTVTGEDYLSLSGQQITANAIDADNLSASDFGDFTCNGTTCSLDNDTVNEAELDLSVVTLADFTNDAGFYVGSVIATSTNPMLATYFSATSTVATSTFPNISTTNLRLGADTVNDITGTGLTIEGGILNTTLGTSIAPTELASSDFGDFTCNGTVCSLDADTVNETELDLTAVTLNDFTNDAGFITSAASSTFAADNYTINGLWRFKNTGTSTFAGGILSSTGLSANYLDIGTVHATGTATSTFVSPLYAGRVTSGSLRSTDLVSCDTVDTDPSGNFKCGTDAEGVGGGSTGPATSTNPLMATYMVATSTTIASQFPYASTTAISAIAASSSKFIAGFGDETTPSYGFHNSSGLGIYRSGANQLAFAAQGALQGYFDGVQYRSAVNMNSGSAGGFYLVVEEGTVDHPTYAFQGDSNMGMYRADTDKLGFSTNSFERMVIDSSGRVGIATSTPGTSLGVTGAGVFTDRVTATHFYATSTTATSTFKGNVIIEGNLEVLGNQFGAGTTALIATAVAAALAAMAAAVMTLTNKRIQPRVASTTGSAALTPDLSSANVYYRTAINGALTINAPTGTPVIGEAIALYLTDNGTGRALTIDATYVFMGEAAPTTTVASKTLLITAQYNGTDWKSMWAEMV